MFFFCEIIFSLSNSKLNIELLFGVKLFTFTNLLLFELFILESSFDELIFISTEFRFEF